MLPIVFVSVLMSIVLAFCSVLKYLTRKHLTHLTEHVCVNL